MLYTRWPSSRRALASFSSIFLLTTPERKPRTLCACHPVACCNSAAVTPPSRWIRASMVARLLAGLPLVAIRFAFDAFWGAWASASTFMAFAFGAAACFFRPTFLAAVLMVFVVCIVILSFVFWFWVLLPTWTFITLKRCKYKK